MSFMMGVMCVTSVVAHADSLRDSIAHALKSHPAIEGAKSGYLAARHGVKAEKSNYYPSVSASIAGGRVYQDNATSRGLVVDRGADYSGYGEGSVSMRQMLFDGQETQYRVQAATAREESLGFALMDIKERIALRTAQSYIDILRVRAALSILDQQSENIRDYMSRISDMAGEGVTDNAQLQQARDVLVVIDGVRADYEGQLISAQAAYREASGQSVPAQMDIPPSLYAHIGQDIKSAAAEAIESHPTVQSARMESRAKRHEAKAEGGRMYPDVSGELSYLESDKKDTIGGEVTDARALVRMSWDFSTGLGQVASMKQRQYEHYEAAAKRDEMRRQVERDIYQSYATYQTYQKKLDLAAERVELNDELLSAYKTQFEGARISLLSLMKAESQYFNALLEKNDNMYYCLSSEYAVLASMGRLAKTLLDSEEQNGAAMAAHNANK